MSLKAKLEAVIYAAEEPVTLAQLALLFTAEALEWKAEQQAAATALAADTPTPASEVGEGQVAENGEFDYLVPDLLPNPGLPASPEESVDAAAAPSAETFEEAPAQETAVLDTPAPETPRGAIEAPAETTAQDESKELEPAPEPGEAVPDETELKRQARQRDKEVRAILRQLLDELIVEYAADNRGIEIREIAGGYRMATKPECHDVVRAFVKSLKPALKLSLPALETLAVVAYKQPVTAPEVNEIRGVDSSGVFGSLLARKLIATAGRKPVIGRPILYKTTKEFLMRFGLKDVSELPSMEEFEKMAAIELEEPEVAGKAEAPAEPHGELHFESGAAEPTEPAAESTSGAETESTETEASPPSTE